MLRISPYLSIFLRRLRPRSERLIRRHRPSLAARAKALLKVRYRSPFFSKEPVDIREQNETVDLVSSF